MGVTFHPLKVTFVMLTKILSKDYYKLIYIEN